MNTHNLIERLREQAQEIATAGLSGWGNTMIEAAEMLQSYDSAGFRDGFSNGVDETIDDIKSLCQDYCDRRESVYIKDVFDAIDEIKSRIKSD